VAGSDNSAGAGLQADLKTFTAHRVFGLTVVTCVVAEVPGIVEAVEAMPASLVRQQLELSLKYYPVTALKTGMLWSAEIIATVAEVLRAQPSLPKLVVDPVMVASSGDRLLQDDAVEAYRELLFPLATVLTPNADELGVLAGRKLLTHADLQEAGRDLARQYNTAILAKGGHLGGPEAIDLLISPEGEVKTYKAPFLQGFDFHGAGCTFSAAVTASLAKGLTLPEAVGEAKAFMRGATRDYLSWPSPPGAPLIALNQSAWTPPSLGLT
jgi:hydroxymethylpyrimidine/phosphomethylpyrimidine kinase